LKVWSRGGFLPEVVVFDGDDAGVGWSLGNGGHGVKADGDGGDSGDDPSDDRKSERAQDINQPWGLSDDPAV
jgi:hypothetical protein